MVLTWTPMVERVVDKEFGTEKECWDYYETEIAPNTTVTPNYHSHIKLP